MLKHPTYLPLSLTPRLRPWSSFRGLLPWQSVQRVLDLFSSCVRFLQNVNNAVVLANTRFLLNEEEVQQLIARDNILTQN